jgi:hypothetical protein
LLSDDSKHFQSNVRKRILLNTFDTEIISRLKYRPLLPTKKEYARKQPVKLWRRSDTQLTFLANLDQDNPHRHYQFALNCFQHTAELQYNRLILTFNQPRDIEQKFNDHRTNKRRKSSLAAIIPWKKRKEDHPSGHIAEGQPSSSQLSLKLHDIDDCHLQTLDKETFKDGWDAIEIQFTHDGGQYCSCLYKNSSNLSTDAERFITACFDSKVDSRLPPSNGPHFVHPHSRPALPYRPSTMAPTEKFFPKIPFLEIENANVFSEQYPNPAAVIWWDKLIDMRKQIFPHGIVDSLVPVKIAILDTGIDTTNPYITKHWGSKNRYRDFLNDDDAAQSMVASKGYYELDYVRRAVDSLAERDESPTDITGHGTHLAGIVIQVAPDADLYVGRVLRDNWTTHYDTGAAAKRVALVSSFIPVPRGHDLTPTGQNKRHK